MKPFVTILALTASVIAQSPNAGPFPPGATLEQKKEIIRQRAEHQRVTRSAKQRQQLQADREQAAKARSERQPVKLTLKVESVGSDGVWATVINKYSLKHPGSDQFLVFITPTPSPATVIGETIHVLVEEIGSREWNGKAFRTFRLK